MSILYYRRQLLSSAFASTGELSDLDLADRMPPPTCRLRRLSRSVELCSALRQNKTNTTLAIAMVQKRTLDDSGLSTRTTAKRQRQVIAISSSPTPEAEPIPAPVANVASSGSTARNSRLVRY
ncbi:hypothetical protein BJ508DRAFT_89079 [Ascobolus immersus RN42]|uniref:Uncharacterized protein n=1 Tax=Ascobolus immersus RN42 TaxID=1160509 RepID=A0A3N4IAK4_ASCIM|nr:hypothetical protein BJ508DRAFT_89079 [Ascobolus immersus RN42]